MYSMYSTYSRLSVCDHVLAHVAVSSSYVHWDCHCTCAAILWPPLHTALQIMRRGPPSYRHIVRRDPPPIGTLWDGTVRCRGPRMGVSETLSHGHVNNPHACRTCSEGSAQFYILCWSQLPGTLRGLCWCIYKSKFINCLPDRVVGVCMRVL
jgi:hypothetical protein